VTGKPTYEELERRVRELERAESRRKQTEEAQQASEAKYRTLFESVNDAVLVHRIDSDGTPGKFIAANRVALDRLGYTREELLNLTPQAIAPDEVFSDLSKVRASIASAGASLFETAHLCSDGRRIPVESHVSVLELAGERIAIRGSNLRCRAGSWERGIGILRMALSSTAISGLRCWSIGPTRWSPPWNSSNGTSIPMI